MSKPNPRMHFIPEVREVIRQQLAKQGVTTDVVNAALEQWDSNLNPRSPLEIGCFAAFAFMQNEIEGK